MNTSSSSDAISSHRALVLGGGGSTGNAWLIGVIAGLYDSGLDVSTADLTVGTSAGSTAAAQLTAATPAELYAAVRDEGPVVVTPRPAPVAPAPAVAASTAAVNDHLDRMRRIIDDSSGVADMRRRVGALALEREAASDGTWRSSWRETVASRLPHAVWPERTVQLTAVDAATGEPVVFDRTSGVDLIDAVAASCSSGLPYEIDGRHYIDGGFRSNAENADLAAGYARVLILAPFGNRSLVPESWGTHLATQVAELHDGGGAFEVVTPSSETEYLFGANAMDFRLRPTAAEAGYVLGQREVARIARLWE